MIEQVYLHGEAYKAPRHHGASCDILVSKEDESRSALMDWFCFQFLQVQLGALSVCA